MIYYYISSVPYLMIPHITRYNFKLNLQDIFDHCTTSYSKICRKLFTKY